MRTILIIAWFSLVSPLRAEERVAVTAGSGRFEVVQEYRGGGDQGGGGFLEVVRFRESKLPQVRLASWSWPGIYSISPDENWLLRTQKAGSGVSIAILYRVEDNGRVSEVLGFDEMLWRTSDLVSRLKQKDLYHTGVEGSTWSADHRFLEIALRGRNASKNDDVLQCRIQYDLGGNVAAVNQTNNEQGAGASPDASPAGISSDEEASDRE